MIKLRGTVITGDKIGRTIGFPTANLDTKDHGLVITGVYCGFVMIDNKRYKAVMCVNWQDVVEVHILDGFDQDIYNRAIDVEVVKFIRAMQRIDDTDLLKEVIAKDVERAKELLAE